MTGLLILGGARSGKSHYAQQKAETSGLKCLFVATAQALDAEMQDRVARHRNDRDSRWETVEVPLDLPAVIAERAVPDTVLLVDCLTLWTSNLMLADRDITAATAALIATITDARGPVMLVANEVGLGIVPDNALARRFRDEAGRMNRLVAAAVGEVQFVVAGLPMRLK